MDKIFDKKLLQNRILAAFMTIDYVLIYIPMIIGITAVGFTGGMMLFMCASNTMVFDEVRGERQDQMVRYLLNLLVIHLHMNILFIAGKEESSNPHCDCSHIQANNRASWWSSSLCNDSKLWGLFFSFLIIGKIFYVLKI